MIISGFDNTASTLNFKSLTHLFIIRKDRIPSKKFWCLFKWR
jgi:hypothetical protein